MLKETKLIVKFMLTFYIIWLFCQNLLILLSRLLNNYDQIIKPKEINNYLPNFSKKIIL